MKGFNTTDIIQHIYRQNITYILQFRFWLPLFINTIYMGTLSYADYITISCPSLYGLNSMLDICNNLAHDNVITFTKKKTVCINLKK